jgi:molybdopterin converting factor small subunit
MNQYEKDIINATIIFAQMASEYGKTDKIRFCDDYLRRVSAVQINLYATFRLNAGFKSLVVDLPEGTSLYNAILEIVRQNPVLRTDWLDDNDELHAHVLVFINGKEITTLPDRLETPLKSDDVLDFFPPVGGG